MRKPDIQLSGGHIYQAEAQPAQCKCPEVSVCLVHFKSSQGGLVVAAQSKPGEECVCSEARSLSLEDLSEDYIE